MEIYLQEVDLGHAEEQAGQETEQQKEVQWCRSNRCSNIKGGFGASVPPPLAPLINLRKEGAEQGARQFLSAAGIA